MTKLQLAMLACAPLMLISCASIVEGSSQDIRIHTAQPSNCTVTNSRGTQQIGTNAAGQEAAKVHVKRSKTDLNVYCQDVASKTPVQSTAPSDLENWWWGNIALLSPLGLIIDGSTGAMWEYPKDITVPQSAAPVATTK